MKLQRTGTVLVALLSASGAVADTQSTLHTQQECMGRKALDAAADTTVGQLREQCEAEQEALQSTSLLAQRFTREKQAQDNPFVITPHKPNYILPVSYAENINDEAWKQVTGDDDPLEDYEAKFQLSLKVPMNSDDLFVEGDALYFGFTLQAYWQVYNGNYSAPFRETNYQPELFYMMPLNFKLFGGDTAFGVGIEHQSNGRGGSISRSWNRAYSSLLWSNDNLVMGLRPWYRFEEDEEDDDNPDIDDYLGHFEYTFAYRWEDLVFSGMARRNFDEGNGAFQAGLSFPLYGRLKGYIQYFNGYGESLIDYDRDVERIGVGVLLTDLM
ncbi:MAG: phospholipase A [Halioglobus sp.]